MEDRTLWRERDESKKGKDREEEEKVKWGNGMRGEKLHQLHIQI